MLIIPDAIAFDWDKGNLNKNYLKHNITNQEAEEVFGNEPLLISEDAKHSVKEKRFQALGKTNKDRIVFLFFTVRKNKIRIISIRDVNKKEETEYEKAKSHSKI